MPHARSVTNHSAEGNLIQQGSFTFVYNALNQQVRQTYSPTQATEVVFGINGQVASLWWAGGAQIMGKAYWGSTPVESYQVGANAAYFQHFDWNLNKRLTTTYSGAVSGQHAELPFGDGFHNVTGGRDNTFDDYAGLWDNGSEMHAQFREYSNMAGRWFSPDPYSGSYDPTNPQSFNRYAYVLNNPLSFVDMAGLGPCDLTGLTGNSCTVWVFGGPIVGGGGGDRSEQGPGDPLIYLGSRHGGAGGAGTDTNPSNLSPTKFAINLAIQFLLPAGLNLPSCSALDNLGDAAVVAGGVGAIGGALTSIVAPPLGGTIMAGSGAVAGAGAIANVGAKHGIGCW